MAFYRKYLQAIGAQVGGTPTMWSYTTVFDTAATLNSSGYFNDAADILQVGDLIYAVTNSIGPQEYFLYVVRSNTGGVVDVTDGMSIHRDNVFLTAYLADVSTPGQIYVVSPITGTIAAVYTALNGAITGADSILTVKTAAGTVGTITVAQSGSAAGDVDSLTTGLVNNTVNGGATVEIETDGGSTNTVPLMVTIIITPTGNVD